MKKRGYTMVEMVIVIALISILAFIFAAYITEAIDAWVFTRARASALSICRVNLERMVRELRSIRRPATILIAASQECQFISTASESVDLKQTGGNLLRNSFVMTGNLVSPEGLAFAYYDSNLNFTTVSQDIRYIKVKLQVIKGAETVILEDGARLRNL